MVVEKYIEWDLEDQELGTLPRSPTLAPLTCPALSPVTALELHT